MAYNAGASSGNKILIETVNASAVAEFEFLSNLSGYDVLYCQYYNLTVSTALNLRMQISTDGGMSYDTGSNYDVAGFASVPAALVNYAAANETGFRLGTDLVNTATFAGAGEFYLFNPSASVYRTYQGQYAGISGSGWYFCGYGAVNDNVTSVVNAIKIFTSTGTVSGTFKLYGIQN